MSDTRPVWLTHADVSWLHTSADTPQRAEALMRLNVGFNSAPSDAAEAVNEALSDTKWAMRAQPIVSAVLRALGMPDAHLTPGGSA